MSNNSGRRVARPATTPEPNANDASTPVFAENYPRLYLFLEKPRKTSAYQKTGCLTIFWEDGVFKVCLNDRPNYRSAFVSAQGLGECFRIADRGLGTGTLKWNAKAYRGSAQKELFSSTGRYQDA